MQTIVAFSLRNPLSGTFVALFFLFSLAGFAHILVFLYCFCFFSGLMQLVFLPKCNTLVTVAFTLRIYLFLVFCPFESCFSPRKMAKFTRGGKKQGQYHTLNCAVLSLPPESFSANFLSSAVGLLCLAVFLIPHPRAVCKLHDNIAAFITKRTFV